MSEQTEIAARLADLLADEFEIDRAEVTPDASLRDALDIDSLDMVDLIVLVNDNFGVRLKKEDMKDIRTFADLYIASQTNAR